MMICRFFLKLIMQVQFCKNELVFELVVVLLEMIPTRGNDISNNAHFNVEGIIITCLNAGVGGLVVVPHLLTI